MVADSFAELNKIDTQPLNWANYYVLANPEIFSSSVVTFYFLICQVVINIKTCIYSYKMFKHRQAYILLKF
jgi:hypothetical protein